MTQQNRLTDDDMELGSGFADDFDAVITEAWFDIKTDYAQASGTNDVLLQLQLTSPDLESPIEQAWSLGASALWGAEDGGAKVVSGKNSDNKRWNGNSRAGELVDFMFKAVGKGDRKAGQKFFIDRQFFMTEAPFYAGLNFHWKQQKLQTMSGDTRDVLMPVEFLGVTDGVVAPATKATSSQLAQVAQAVVASDGAESANLDLLLTIAEGKTERQLKAAYVQNATLAADEGLQLKIFREGYLATLVTEGKLVVGEDGTYSAP